MLCWISILGGLLIMMGHHARSEALFYHTQLSPAFSAAQQNSTFDLHKGALWRALLPSSLLFIDG